MSENHMYGNKLKYDTQTRVDRCKYQLEKLEADVLHIYCSGVLDYLDESSQYYFNCYRKSLETALKTVYDLNYLADKLEEVL